MPEEAKATEAAGSTASPAARTDFVAESVKAALAQVKGESATAESAATQETAKPAAPAGEAQSAESQESGTQETETVQPSVLSGDDLKTYLKKTPIWDWEPEKLPEELRASAKALRSRAGTDLQEIAKQKKQLGGNSDGKTKPETTQETGQRADGEKTYSRDELYDMIHESPEGMEQAFKIFVAQNVPESVKKTLTEQSSQQRAQMETNIQQTATAIDNLSDERVPELADKAFQETVARVIENDARLANRIVSAKSVEEIEDAIELAAARARKQQPAPAKPKPNAGKSADQIEREKKNAGEKNSIAARKGSKVGTVDEGPMTVSKSLQLAKQRVAAGESPV